jgi:hypothetical protein
MVQSLDSEDQRACYERVADAPVTTGDHVFGKRVIGFCHSKQGDQILVEGEDHLSEPPDRPLPCRGAPDGLERTGRSPVAALPANCLQPAPADLRAAIENAFDSRADGQYVRRLLDEIVARKHHAWLVGGVVRDLLAAGGDRMVRDFDVTGTIGPGCLNAMVRLRRSSDAGDYIPWLSPQNVWSVTLPGQRGQRLVEYKPLARTGFRFPVWGGSLDEDAATRDLTFNALYYDRQAGVLVDPSGAGIAHLNARVMVTSYRGTDAVEQAAIILRCLKFRLRSREIDITPIVAWIRDELPDDFVTRIPEQGWKRLAATRRWGVLPELNGREEIAAAGELGPKAARLLREIRKRT